MTFFTSTHCFVIGLEGDDVKMASEWYIKDEFREKGTSKSTVMSFAIIRPLVGVHNVNW